VLEELFALHSARWKTRGEHSVLDDEKTRQFHREAAQRLSLAGALRLYRVRLDGQTIGVLYAFTDTRSTYYYLSGFSPEFHKLSPGTLLVGHAIEKTVQDARSISCAAGSHTNTPGALKIAPLLTSISAVDRPVQCAPNYFRACLTPPTLSLTFHALFRVPK
jgi:hypothetical protein